jgi:hypothetical protein
MSKALMATSKSAVYYIGDLGYVTSPEEWRTYCYQVPVREVLLGQADSEDGVDTLFYLDPENSSDDEESGRPFYAFSTAYGDGVFADNSGRRYSVDSGGIGCIRVENLSDKGKVKEAVKKGLAHLIEVSEPITADDCSWTNGTLIFGEVIIETGELG